jgi:ankyrin repeat protein
MMYFCRNDDYSLDSLGSITTVILEVSLEYKYLVEKGSDVYADNDNALISSTEKGHFEIAKYLVEQGAEFHADNLSQN